MLIQPSLMAAFFADNSLFAITEANQDHWVALCIGVASHLMYSPAWVDDTIVNVMRFMATRCILIWATGEAHFCAPAFSYVLRTKKRAPSLSYCFAPISIALKPTRPASKPAGQFDFHLIPFTKQIKHQGPIRGFHPLIMKTPGLFLGSQTRIFVLYFSRFWLLGLRNRIWFYQGIWSILKRTTLVLV